MSGWKQQPSGWCLSVAHGDGKMRRRRMWDEVDEEEDEEDEEEEERDGDGGCRERLGPRGSLTRGFGPW